MSIVYLLKIIIGVLKELDFDREREVDGEWAEIASCHLYASLALDRLVDFFCSHKF